MIRPELTVFVFMILSLVVGVLLSPNFLDIRFLLGSTIFYCELGLMAIPFTLLLTSGEIDLSIAANMSLVACLVAVLYQAGMSMPVLIVIGIAAGTLLGFFNGLLVTVTKLPSLVITIGIMSVYQGFSQVLVGDAAISGFPEWFIGLDQYTILGLIPLNLIILIVVALIFSFLLKKTVWGRKVTAIGRHRIVFRRCRGKNKGSALYNSGDILCNRRYYDNVQAADGEVYHSGRRTDGRYHYGSAWRNRICRRTGERPWDTGSIFHYCFHQNGHAAGASEQLCTDGDTGAAVDSCNYYFKRVRKNG